MVRDAIAVAAIAVLTVQALRRWCGDRYIVPSNSMQPVLYGDPRYGDIVFVDKLASAAARRRHDLVVVQHPDPEKPSQQLVKRIAAVGDDQMACCIDIRGGDIWLGPDQQHMQRETKDPLEARSMRVPWASWPSNQEALLDVRAAVRDGVVLRIPALDFAAAEARGLFTSKARSERRLDPALRVVPTGFLGTAKPVDATYVDATGTRGLVGEDVGMADCGMDLELLDPVAGLLCSIDSSAEVLTFHWQPATGRIELWRNGETVKSADLPPSALGVHRIEFGLLDDRAFFVVDGDRDGMFVVARRSEWQPEREPRKVPHCYVHLGVVGDQPLRLASLRVFHDVFARREPIVGMPGLPNDWPKVVKAGTWFLLGDSPFDSRDSRQFGPVPSSSFLGVPRLVLGPWPRCRWLSS